MESSFMFPVYFMDCWSMYVLDHEKKLFMVMDPKKTHPTYEVEKKHSAISSVGGLSRAQAGLSYIHSWACTICAQGRRTWCTSCTTFANSLFYTFAHGPARF